MKPAPHLLPGTSVCKAWAGCRLAMGEPLPRWGEYLHEHKGFGGVGAQMGSKKRQRFLEEHQGLARLPFSLVGETVWALQSAQHTGRVLERESTQRKWSLPLAGRGYFLSIPPYVWGHEPGCPQLHWSDCSPGTPGIT